MDLDSEIERIRSFEKKFKGKAIPTWYGHGYWLRKYLGIPQFVPLLVHMDHGAAIQDEPSNSDLTSGYPILVTRRARKNWLEKEFGKGATVMGSPFVHYRHLAKIERLPGAKGTVAFPSHSTHLVRSIFDWARYAESLKQLATPFHPVKVCMYWKDLIDQSHQVFLDQGLEVVTAGHMSDPAFASKFYEILRYAEYATSNLIGSYVYYAVEMGIPFFLYGDTPIFDNTGEDTNVPSGTYSIHDSTFSKSYRREDFVFDLSKSVTITSAVRQSCLEKLGADEIIDKNALRKIIFLSLLRNGPMRLISRLFRLFKTVMIRDTGH